MKKTTVEEILALIPSDVHIIMKRLKTDLPGPRWHTRLISSFYEGQGQDRDIVKSLKKAWVAFQQNSSKRC